MGLKILISEGSSLTAREFLNVLGPRGHWIEVVDSNPLCICRFSRWTKRVHACPASGSDPLDYLETVNRLLASGDFDVLLPTHEQTWLFAAARQKLHPDVPIAVAPAVAFSYVQSKLEFARLLDELNLPQPKWALVESPDELMNWQLPFYLKAPFSTAGSGVRRVTRMSDAAATFQSLQLASNGEPLMVQAAAVGQYAQVQALFDHGRLVAAHTSAQTAVGIGPSAAGRVSVDHPFARQDAARLGRHLNWHGGLTLDYLFQGQDPVYIECNPRTVEPANAAASGVDLPGLQLALSLGEHPGETPAGQPGVRTHSALGMLRNQIPSKDSREVLTPCWQDPLSAIILLAVLGRILLSPKSAESLSAATVKAYAVPPQAIQRLTAEAILP